MAAQFSAPCFPSNFNASLHNFIVNDVPIPEVFLDLVPIGNLLQFKKAIISAAYWNRRLVEEINPLTLILGFINFQGLQMFNVQQFLEILKSVIPISKVEMVFPTESQFFMGIVLKDKETVDILLQNLQNFGDTTTIFLGKSDSKNIPIKILWGTPSISLDIVKQKLLPYFEEINIRREIVVFQETNVLSGTIIGTASLKTNVLIDDIPYFLDFQGNNKKRLLLNIRGRPLICLKCGEKGHMRRKCLAMKCNFCRQFHPTNHFCSESQNRLSSVSKSLVRVVPGLNFNVPEVLSNMTPLGKPKIHKMQPVVSDKMIQKEKVLADFDSVGVENYSPTDTRAAALADRLVLDNPFSVLQDLNSDLEFSGVNMGASEISEMYKDNKQILEKGRDADSICFASDKHMNDNLIYKSIKRARETESEGGDLEFEPEISKPQLLQDNVGKVCRNLRSQNKEKR